MDLSAKLVCSRALHACRESARPGVADRRNLRGQHRRGVRGRALPDRKAGEARGYIWKFHKSDTDNWPSPLHGHDYDKGLKLDAITGDIYDVGTRGRCKTLKGGDLQAVQAELRASKDFGEAVATLIGNTAAATGLT